MPANPIPPFADTAESAFTRLLTVLNTLREQCPWDKKQTMGTLRHLTIEETYELSEAIVEGDMQEVKKELGDLMTHLVFYAKIAQEERHFNIIDVLNSVCDKLVDRHPHIYGHVYVENEEQVKQNWEKIKLKGSNKSVLSGVPPSLPALIKAGRIQEKARGVGFDWEKKEQVWQKIEEELNEFKAEYNSQTHLVNPEKAEEEFGDLLFSLINYARFININPENALEKTNKKFIKRFQYLEKRAKEIGKPLQGMTLAEMDTYWNQAKTL